jgi:hypothetical protein
MTSQKSPFYHRKLLHFQKKNQFTTEKNVSFFFENAFSMGRNFKALKIRVFGIAGVRIRDCRGPNSRDFFRTHMQSLDLSNIVPLSPKPKNIPTTIFRGAPATKVISELFLAIAPPKWPTSPTNAANAQALCPSMTTMHSTLAQFRTLMKMEKPWPCSASHPTSQRLSRLLQHPTLRFTWKLVVPLTKRSTSSTNSPSSRNRRHSNAPRPAPQQPRRTPHQHAVHPRCRRRRRTAVSAALL